jgi:hypothetical protein
MITAVLQGGLGNQMFQYAMALEQAHRLRTNLRLDITSLLRDRMRVYNLDLFPNLQNECKIAGGKAANIVEHGMPFNQGIYDSVQDGDVIRGYWQSEKYFQSPIVREVLRESFTTLDKERLNYRDALLVDTINEASELSTFVGIRRTDYVQKQDYHGVIPQEWYRKALLDLKLYLGYDPVVFVISDEPQWCEKHLDLGFPFTMIGSWGFTTPDKRGREDIDMYLMSRCWNAVIANSTFHWWGAWLGPTANRRVVIAPDRWFTTNEVDSKDIIPARWWRQ